MQFKALVVVASLVAASVAQTFSMFEDNLKMKVVPAMNNLNATIHEFPMMGGRTVKKAMAIHYSVMDLVDAANSITDIMNVGSYISVCISQCSNRLFKKKMTSKFSDEEGMKILSDFQGMKPTFMDAMQGMVARMPALNALPRGGVTSLVEKDLEDLKSCAEAFITAFNDHVSPEMVKEAEPLEDMGISTISQVMQIHK
ncbi:hypothetical protein C0993_008646 [Termitomyces sp. T159_Od127]|nr:hypothetical protein C0993_008646 [Termitomyces sp. T159_Od127]